MSDSKNQITPGAMPTVNLSQVVVISPALNEEQSLPLVLNDLPDVAAIFVVDNGCTDATPEVAKSMGANVVKCPVRGYGAACLAGIEAVNRWATFAEHCPNPVVVFVDADYSDHVHLLPTIVQPIFDNEFDFVLGSRLLGEREKGAMPPQSVWGNRFACGIMNFLFKTRYTDLGPFRALKLDELNNLQMVDSNFGWTIEMQIKAARNKLRIVELPVPYRCRTGTSKISGTISGSVKAGCKILYSIWKYRK